MYGLWQTTATYCSPGFPPAGEREGGFYYLGNITHQVNTSNTVVAEYNFDAWGRRRSADDWSSTLDANDLPLFADRGFTAHEHLPWFNLINMNGRLYDPLVGRFLSPDNYVQAPGYTQSFNRYSYCLNSPLKYTDPSGMLQRPVDEYDASFDAYFSWMTGEAAWYGNNGQSGWGASRGGGGKDDYFGNWANSFGITHKILGGFDDTSIFRGLHFKNHKDWYVEDGFDALIALLANYSSGQGGRHSTASDLWNITMGGAGTLADVKSNGMHNSIYWVQKNGKVTLTKNIGNNYLLKRSNRIVGETLQNGKMVAKPLTQVNIAYSAADYALTWATTGSMPTFGKGMDLFFTSVAAIPGAGWAVSGGYWVISAGSYAITGKWMSEHMDSWVY
jgi:RHS repeat-associated protein